jgi:PAS domain S-box-containing protein
MTWREALHQSPLARRLILWTILFSSAVTLLLTTLQLYRDYRRDISQIERNFAEIETVHLATLTESLWATDKERLQLQLDGMLQLRDMHYLEIREGSQVWARAGQNASHNVIRREIPLRYRHDGREQVLGTLVAVATLDNVYARLLREAFTILVSNGVKTFLVAVFMLLLIYYQVTRHLLVISRFAHQFNLLEPPPPLTLDRAPQDDELRTTVLALNQLNTRLSESVQKLAESEKRFRFAFEQAAVGVAQVAPDGRFLRVNQKLCDIVGYPRDELIAKTFQDITHPDDLDADLAQMRQVLANDIQTYSMEKRYIRKDGRNVWINLTVSLVRKPDGKPDYFIAVVEDVGARKRADEALKQSEQRLRSVIDGLGPQMFVGLMALDGVVLEANRPALAAANLAPQDVLGKLCEETYWWNYSAESKRQLRENIARAACGDSLRYDVQIRVGENQFITVDFSIQPLRDETGKIVFLVPSANVITEQRQAEKALASVSEQLRELLTNMADGFVRLDRDWRYTFVNKRAGQMFGRSPEELLGRDIWEEFPEGIGQPFYRAYHKAMADQQVSQIQSYYPPWDKWFENRIYPSPEGVSIFFDDITERKRSEAALRERDEVLRLFVEHSPAAIAMLDAEMRYVVVSRRWMSDYGLGDREIIGRSHYEVFPEIAQRWRDIHQRCLAGATERSDEDPFLRADGHTDWVKWEICPWRRADGEVEGIILFSEMVTERKLAEMEREKLLSELTVRNTEMESFIYTISHDLKSPLITIGGFSSLLEKDIARGDHASIADSLGEIKKAVALMQAHIHDLLLLSRTGRVSAERTDVPLNALLAEVTGQLGQRITDEGAQLIIAPDLPVIRADHSGIVRVYTNLIDNALKYRRPDIAPIIEVGWQQQDHELRLYVRDNGQGIKQEYQQRVFGLFQRIDSKIEGTGVGLAISKRVIEVHGGRMWVESLPGKGSTFWIGLPETTVVRA